MGALDIISVTKQYQCSQYTNIGKFTDQLECAYAASGNSSCPTNDFMWSDVYYPNIPCRCCKSGSNYFDDNADWDLYEYQADSGTSIHLRIVTVHIV